MGFRALVLTVNFAWDPFRVGFNFWCNLFRVVTRSFRIRFEVYFDLVEHLIRDILKILCFIILGCICPRFRWNQFCVGLTFGLGLVDCFTQLCMLGLPTYFFLINI